MTIDTKSTPMNTLSDLLDIERAALLKGDLEKVTNLLESKETLFEQVGEEEELDEGALQVLEDKIKRNQLLLDGALEGIKAVTERMSALRRVQTSIETYGSDGRRKEIQLKPTSSVERRA